MSIRHVFVELWYQRGFIISVMFFIVVLGGGSYYMAKCDANFF